MDTNSEYIPEPFTTESVDDILDDLNSALMKAYSKRYSNLCIAFEGIQFNATHMSTYVKLLNRNQSVKSGMFDFQQYSEYWDISDYQQHIAVTIQQFVSTL